MRRDRIQWLFHQARSSTICAPQPKMAAGLVTVQSGGSRVGARGRRLRCGKVLRRVREAPQAGWQDGPLLYGGWTNRKAAYRPVRDETAAALIVAEAPHESAPADFAHLTAAIAADLAELRSADTAVAVLTRAAPRISSG